MRTMINEAEAGGEDGHPDALGAWGKESVGRPEPPCLHPLLTMLSAGLQCGRSPE